MIDQSIAKSPTCGLHVIINRQYILKLFAIVISASFGVDENLDSCLYSVFFTAANFSKSWQVTVYVWSILIWF